MNNYLGIDTSNYTTSVAAYNNNKIIHSKKLLPVKQGQLGLRQSDAVFHHVQQLPDVMNNVISRLEALPTAIGVSKAPRDIQGSYMPCFTVGISSAKILSSVLNVPCYMFSHQTGHIVAALYSANRLDLLNERFLAFHVSGGTTEAVIVEPDRDSIIRTNLVAKTLDLNAGQAVDRVGNMLGLDFPAGPKIDELALQYNGKSIKVNPAIKGYDCCLSGVENICQKMKVQGSSDIDVSRYCVEYILKSLDIMCERILNDYGKMTILFAGGVMSNSIINRELSSKYNALFAKPEFSSDNAAGIAILTSIKSER